jgi:hypothetical protein
LGYKQYAEQQVGALFVSKIAWHLFGWVEKKTAKFQKPKFQTLRQTTVLLLKIKAEFQIKKKRKVDLNYLKEPLKVSSLILLNPLIQLRLQYLLEGTSTLTFNVNIQMIYNNFKIITHK